MKTQVLVVHPRCIRHLQMGPQSSTTAARARGSEHGGFLQAPKQHFGQHFGRQEPGWKRNTNRPLGEKAPKRPSAYGVVGVLSHRQNSSSGQSWHHGGVTLCLFWYAGLGAQLKKCIAIPAHLCKAVCFLILPTLSYIQYLMQDNPIFKKT